MLCVPGPTLEYIFVIIRCLGKSRSNFHEYLPMSEMNTLLFVVVLLVSKGLGAPVSELQELDKRRESTPEILNLEKELKKAAGEDKQYFSANGARPVPQTDGLAAQAEREEGMPDDQENELPVNEAGFGREDEMEEIPGSNEGVEPHISPTYSQMWNMFQQHPDYFEDDLQDYMNREIEEQAQTRESQGVKRDSIGDNAMLSTRYYPNQDEPYMSSDAEDISNSLMAEYFASANQRHRHDNPEELHDVEVDSEEDGNDDYVVEDDHDEDDKDYENDEDEQSDDGSDNEEVNQSHEHEESDGEDNNGELEDDNESHELDDLDEKDKLDSSHPIESSKPMHDVGDMAVPPPYHM